MPGAGSSSGVSVVDLDNDGDLDVLFASRDDSRIGWSENKDGQGTFGPTLEIDTVNEPRVMSMYRPTWMATAIWTF